MTKTKKEVELTANMLKGKKVIGKRLKKDQEDQDSDFQLPGGPNKRPKISSQTESDMQQPVTLEHQDSNNHLDMPSAQSNRTDKKPPKTQRPPGYQSQWMKQNRELKAGIISHQPVWQVSGNSLSNLVKNMPLTESSGVRNESTKKLLVELIDLGWDHTPSERQNQILETLMDEEMVDAFVAYI